MAGRRDGPLMRGGGGPSRGSRIAMAVAVGIALGCVFAFLFPDGFFRSNLAKLNSHSSFRSLQITSPSCDSGEKTTALKTDLSNLSQKNAELQKQIKDLTTKLRLAEQSKDQAQKQFLALGKQPKAGPFGTVKSLRTNPPLLPDPSANPKLSKLLENITVNKELIVAVANSNVKDMLHLWFTNIKRVKIPNYVVVALDDDTEAYCASHGVPVHRTTVPGLDAAAATGGNHAVSGLKFRILREFLQLGYSVLLSDIDIVYLQSPFDYLHRDCDVESMSDGHSNATAYGFNDVFDEPGMGWSRYAHTMRIWVYNSGFFYIRPTAPALELLDRVAGRLAREEKVWDQAAFNEELFYPSRPGYEGLHASRRTMDIYRFMNSKVLFKTVRKDEGLRRLLPAVVHVNYHPDKLVRMKAVVEFYVDGKLNALDPFPDGSDW